MGHEILIHGATVKQKALTYWAVVSRALDFHLLVLFVKSSSAICLGAGFDRVIASHGPALQGRGGRE